MLNKKDKKDKYSIWIALAVLALVTYALLTSIMLTYVDENKSDLQFKFWFDFLHFFTIQSNISICIATIIFMVNYSRKKVNINIFFNITAINITVTSLLWTVVLMPGMIGKTNALSWIDSLVLHIFVPILFVLLYFSVYKNQKNITVSFKKLYIYEFSYISIYIAYLLITPFVEIFGQYHSVYGKFTNFNSNYIIDGIAGSWSNIWIIFAALALLNIVTIGAYFNNKYFLKINNLK